MTQEYNPMSPGSSQQDASPANTQGETQQPIAQAPSPAASQQQSPSQAAETLAAEQQLQSQPSQQVAQQHQVVHPQGQPQAEQNPAQQQVAQATVASQYSAQQPPPPKTPPYSPAQPVAQPMPKQTPKAKTNSSRKSFLYGFLGAALACVLAFSGFGAVALVSNGFDFANSNGGDSITTLGSSDSSEIVQVSEDSTLAEVVAEKALPSVVSVYIYTTQSSQGFGMFGFGYDDSSGELVQSSMGSGVILSEDGYIITNYHVVSGAEKIMVSLAGESELVEATLVGADESSDIAVIKVEGASDLTPIEIGSSSDLSVGEWVMALGSPYGLEQSISTGIVSAVSRSQAVQSTYSTDVYYYVNLIQTDAAINQGNSGGALVDSDGKLIGINTLISSNSGDNSGVGFAIPIDYAIGIAQDLIDGKTPSHAQLGVSLNSVSSSMADRYGLAESEGAYIDAVVEGSGADNAGLKAGDIITEFNGTAISSASDLMLAIRAATPGDTVEVVLNRGGEVMTLEVTLGSDA